MKNFIYCHKMDNNQMYAAVADKRSSAQVGEDSANVSSSFYKICFLSL
jgi:hypothetical protein